MTYISAGYYCLLSLVVLMYYFLPLSKRWIALLSGSILFYWLADSKGIPALFFSIVSSYISARILARSRKRSFLFIAIAVSCIPMWMHLFLRIQINSQLNVLQPLGVSFFSLQIISYLIDVYENRISPEKNLFHYALFISFLPQIIQGPIPRWNQLSHQLMEGHFFDEKGFTKGIQMILWGFFLKMMIADKAAIAVNNAFQNLSMYNGFYSFLILVLYFIQLYADFLACTTLSQGAAQLFGIELVNNFRRPFFSKSVSEFWRRWHMSLSFWMRDYIYIPLGGSRKGRCRKYINILIVFLFSAIWHGNGLQFLFWGTLQAVYQIAGDFTKNVREKAWKKIHVNPEGRFRHCVQVICTFLLIVLSWAPFRANGMKEALILWKDLFRKSFWVPSQTGLFMNLDKKEWIVLLLSIGFLLIAECLQEKGIQIREEILKRKPAFNWFLSIACIWIIFVFGTYGYGYDAQAFIYGGF